MTQFEEYMDSLYKGDCGEGFCKADDPKLIEARKRIPNPKPIIDLTDEVLIDRVCDALISHFLFFRRGDISGNGTSSEWNPYDRVLNALEEECEKRRGFFKNLFRRGQEKAKSQQPGLIINQ